MYDVQLEVKDFAINVDRNALKNVNSNFKNFIQFNFVFDKYWNNMKKVVQFKVVGREECILIENDKVALPAFISGHRNFKMTIYGAKDSQRIETKEKLIQF